MKKRVFISGVTGTMGRAALTHLLKHRDKLTISTIVRDTKKNRKEAGKFKSSSIDIVWGDLRDYGDVKKALVGADYIFHLAAFVSPEADYNPELAWDINVGSTVNILKAVDELNLKDVKLIYIGSVAETGSRLPPIHFGRVGDPLKPSIFDNYAVTKIAAERRVIESGLNYWVSLRQAGILHPGLLNIRDGIIFHQPLNNVLEWVTVEDSARIIENIFIKDLPEKFWKNIYNIGGGKDFRKTNYEFTSSMLKAVGVKDIKKIFNPNWFANRNFHGQYYLDSYILNDYLDFRKDTFHGFLEKLKKEASFPVKLLRFIPSVLIKHLIMKPIAKSKEAPLGWIKSNDMSKVEAFFGSVKEYNNIKNWGQLKVKEDYNKFKILDHGYDESKDVSSLNINDMKKAAKFRGGECLSDSMIEGDLGTKLKWQCGFNHIFEASPRLILKGGHFCEKCEAPPWEYDKIAKINPFFAQVWHKESKIGNKTKLT